MSRDEIADRDIGPVTGMEAFCQQVWRDKRR
jgi:hypothetical protein